MADPNGEHRASGPFVGVRVLELTTGIAGRVAGMLLADLGADVARRVEPDQPARPWQPGDLCWDRGKLLVRVDRTRVGAPTDLRRLADVADVLLIDARPGEAERYGFDAATTLSRTPGLVHAWLPPIGPLGRWSQLPHDPLLLAAVGGFAAHHPAVEDRPVAPVVPTIAYLHGALGAAGIAAGLVGRQTSGRGGAVTVSGLHALASTLGPLMVEGLDVGEVYSLSKSAAGAPNYRMYQASDSRWLYLAALTPDFFFRSLEVLERMDVMVRPDVGGEFMNLFKPDVAAAVGQELATRFAERPCADWLKSLTAAGIPAAPVATRQEWMYGEIVASNAGRIDMEHPELGPVTVPGIPIKFPATPGAVRHLPSDDCVVPVDQVWLEAGPYAATAGSEDELLPLPLAGLHVVDLCTFLAGPIASAILADHGADVVKVEGPTGDAYRVYTLPYLMVNQRKRAVALDLTRPEGRAALLDIVRRADVLVDNLRPSSLERLGLGPGMLAAANPRLVRASVSAYGHEGAFADLPGFDPVMQALSGLASAQGGRGAPVATTAPVVDACTGAIAALGILGALFVRGGEPGPQRVTTSLAAVSTFLQSAEVTSFAGRPPNLEGGVDFPGPDAGHRYYRCRDGWLVLAATTAATRTALLEVVGHPEWSDLDRLVEDLATREVDGLVDELAARHVPAARVLDRHGELHDPFLVENRFSHVVAEPTFGRARVVRAFADWRNAADPPMRGGVVIGEDTRAVLEEAGYDADAIEQLLAGGAAISPKS